MSKPPAEDHPNTAMLVEHDDSEDDIWYGPGFYYGMWFDNEDDYWEWRENHRSYPPNHRYYDPHQPIHYRHPEHEPGDRGGDGRGGGRGGGRSGGGGHGR